MARRSVMLAFCIGIIGCTSASSPTTGDDNEPSGGNGGSEGGQAGSDSGGGGQAGASIAGAGNGGNSGGLGGLAPVTGGQAGTTSPDAGVMPGSDALGPPPEGGIYSGLKAPGKPRPPRPADEDYNPDAISKLRFSPASGDEIAQVRNNMNSLFPGQTFKGSSGLSLPYRMHIPSRDSYKNKAPLLIFMHGAGERGYDNNGQVTENFLPGPGVLAIGARAKALPSFILAPQCPPSDHWDGYGSGSLKEMRLGTTTPAMKTVIELIDSLIKEHPTIDTRRIYVSGLSMGGLGSWEMISRWTDKFAAAAPMAAAGDPEYAPHTLYVPVWAFHSMDDGAVSYVLSQTMINRLRSFGGTPKYTLYNGYGHASWAPAWREPDLLAWMFSQSQ